jgi:hypothetical protein
LRNVYGAAISGSSSAECRGRKRARETEPSPWRPVFRMEDFAHGGFRTEASIQDGVVDVLIQRIRGAWNGLSSGARSPDWAPIVFGWLRNWSIEPPFLASRL